MKPLDIFLGWAVLSSLACTLLMLRVWLLWRRPDPEGFDYFCDCCEAEHHRDPAVASQTWEGATICPPCADMERHAGRCAQ